MTSGRRSSRTRSCSISRREHDAIAGDGPYEPSGAAAYLALHALGAVTTVGDEHDVTRDVRLRWTGAHSPGHMIVDIRSDDDTATMLGHLALSPLHCVVEGTSRLHGDPVAATAVLRTLHDGRLLIGPLWPAPGGVRWTGDSVVTA